MSEKISLKVGSIIFQKCYCICWTKFLDEKLLIDNQKKIKDQFEIFLDFNKSENKALIVNNYDWFNELIEWMKNHGNLSKYKPEKYSV